MIRRWLDRRVKVAYRDWEQARNAWHVVQGTPMASDGDRYLLVTRRRLERWEALYRLLYLRRDDR